MTLLQAGIALAMTITLFYCARLANRTKLRMVKLDENRRR